MAAIVLASIILLVIALCSHCFSWTVFRQCKLSAVRITSEGSCRSLWFSSSRSFRSFSQVFGGIFIVSLVLSLTSPSIFFPPSPSLLRGAWNGVSWLGCRDFLAMGVVQGCCLIGAEQPGAVPRKCFGRPSFLHSAKKYLDYVIHVRDKLISSDFQ